MASNSININYLQTLVTGIKEVTGCHIATDAQGEISEVHVTAESDRRPQLIARDVDTILKVKGGVNVDHRKIQVAMIKTKAPEPPPLETSESDELIIIEEDDSQEPEMEQLALDLAEDERVVYEKLTVSHADGAVSAAVQLRRGERRAVGEVETADTPDGHLAAVVGATLEAMLMLHDADMRFHTPGFDRLRFGREEVLVVYLEAVEGRDLHSFTGAAVIRQDPRQAAVLATLSATNRLTGLWAVREQLDFDIV